MPSLRAVLKKVQRNKYMGEADVNEIFANLDNHDKTIREKTISEFAQAICDRAEEESVDVFFPDGLHGLVIEIEELKSMVSEIAEGMKEGGAE